MTKTVRRWLGLGAAKDTKGRGLTSCALTPNARKRLPHTLSASQSSSHFGFAPAPPLGRGRLHPPTRTPPPPSSRRNRKWDCGPRSQAGSSSGLESRSERTAVKSLPLPLAVASQEKSWDHVEYGEYPFLS